MSGSSPGIGQAFNDGLEAFKKDPVMAIVGTLIYFVLVAFSAIPFLGFVYAIFVVPALAGGFIVFMLNIAKGKKASIEDIFSGFKNYGTYLGTFWLLFAYFVGFGIIGVILIIIGALVHRCIGSFLIVIGLIAWLGLIAFFAIKWAFCMVVVADDWNDGGIMPAFEKSVKITDGRTLETFFVLLILGIFAEAGAIVFGIGALITMPIGALGMVGYYLALKREYLAKQGAAATPPSPPPPPAEPKPPEEHPMEPLSPTPPPGG
jgi:uncharacterized membrane protein